MLRNLYALFFVLMLSGCTGLFFQPYQGHVLEPDRIGLKYEDVHFPSSDGLTLHGWFLPAEGPARGTVLFLHGNAENISTHIGSVYWLPREGYNAFLFDYRGYGDSQGVPTLRGAIDDTESALRVLLARPDVDAGRVIVFGQSLGGALATYVAAHSPQRLQIKALIIDSTFSTYRSIAREVLGTIWFAWPIQWPLSFTVSDTYSPLEAIPHVSPVPVLIIHSEKDPVIGVHHARRLFDAAKDPKELWILPNGLHIQTLSKTENRGVFVKHLETLLEARPIGQTTKARDPH
jgi:hypothetical protein